MTIIPSASRRLLVASSVLALALGACGASASTSPVPSLSATVAPSATTPSPSPAVVASTAPTPTPNTGPTLCQAADLVATITSWEGGTGHRMAHVELKNTGQGACTIHAQAVPQLVDGDGTILIAGAPAAASSLLTFPPGQTLTTVVDDANYCGADPVAPVTVAFVFPSGEGRVVAAPVSPTDTDGVPPCIGTTGAGAIEMHDWAP